jgi:repressor LexA
LLFFSVGLRTPYRFADSDLSYNGLAKSLLYGQKEKGGIMELTSRQREIFNFIRTFIRERGYPPSVREIGERFNIYPRAVFDHLKALERKGYLKRRGSMSRGLEILVFQGAGPYGEHLKKEGKPLSREIPILGRVAAGKPTLAVEHVEGTIPLPAEWVKGKEVFLLK